MNIDITSGITGFLSIFTSIYNWLLDFDITIGSVTFNLIQLAVSLIIIDMMIWFIFTLLRGD